MKYNLWCVFILHLHESHTFNLLKIWHTSKHGLCYQTTSLSGVCFSKSLSFMVGFVKWKGEEGSGAPQGWEDDGPTAPKGYIDPPPPALIQSPGKVADFQRGLLNRTPRRLEPKPAKPSLHKDPSTVWRQLLISHLIQGASNRDQCELKIWGSLGILHHPGGIKMSNNDCAQISHQACGPET